MFSNDEPKEFEDITPYLKNKVRLYKLGIAIMTMLIVAELVLLVGWYL